MLSAPPARWRSTSPRRSRCSSATHRTATASPPSSARRRRSGSTARPIARPRTCNNNRCRETSTSYTTFYLNPRIHYFLIENLSIGGEILLGFTSGERTVRDRVNGATTETKFDAPGPTAIGILPMVGYNIRLGDKFSIWPHGGIGFRSLGYTIEDDNNAINDVEVSHSLWFFTADVPFMLHIAPHFSIGAGPGFTTSLSNKWSSKVNNVEVSQSGYGFTQFRWFNAHIVGYF
jgi:hypothetical protein